MRNAFVKTMLELGKRKDVVLLIADTGQHLLSDFATHYPERFINVGVAEQNMIGIAAGLALSGKIVFCYSIAAFYTRCLDQIRVDLCQHSANVKLIGVGSGLCYGTMGPTHHSIEDIGILRAFPNMRIIVPSDPIEAGRATEAICHMDGPVYLRLGLAGEPVLHSEDYEFHPWLGERLRDGKDATIIATGRMVHFAMLAADFLAKSGVMCRVINMHTIKPLDRVTVRAAAEQTKAILTVEEHSIIGGLGSAVAETLAEMFSVSDWQGSLTPFRMIGIWDSFCRDYGDQVYLFNKLGLSEAHIADHVLGLLRMV